MAFENASRIINGTFGQVFIDGVEIMELSAFQVKTTFNYDAIHICGRMAEDRKLTGVKITGSMTIHTVYSRETEIVPAALSGHDVRKSLIGVLDDPDANGPKRVAVYGLNYDEQTLLDFEAGKAGRVTIPFQATEIQILDSVDPE